MNGISPIRLSLDTVKYQSSSAGTKKVEPIRELETSTEANKKKQFEADLNNGFGSSANISNKKSELLLSDRKYFQANLLGEIVNKMSGLEQRTKPGQYIEYFA